jgi:hypothetical protein
MTKKQAERFCLDVAKNLIDEDLSETLYISIKNKGTKVFKNCRHDRIEGWIFFWSKKETYFVKEKDIGNFVIIEKNMSLSLSLRGK